MAACKRMPAHVEKMKQKDSETEPIMISGSLKPAEREPLKLRRCEWWHTNIAGIDIRTVPNLERVAVDELHGPVSSDEYVAMIHVSHDYALLMNDCEGSGDLGCNANQESEICRRKSF